MKVDEYLQMLDDFVVDMMAGNHIVIDDGLSHYLIGSTKLQIPIGRIQLVSYFHGQNHQSWNCCMGKNTERSKRKELVLRSSTTFFSVFFYPI